MKHFASLYLSLKPLFGGDKMSFVVFLMVCSAVAETIGIMTLIPFIEILSEPKLLNNYSLLNEIFDRLNTQSLRDKLTLLALLVVLVFVISSIVKIVSAYFTLKFVHSSGAKLSSHLFQLFIQQNYRWHLRQNSSQLTKLILSESQLVIGSGLLPLLQMLSNFLIVICIALLLLLKEPSIVVVSSAMIAISYLVLFKAIKPKIDNLSSKRNLANSGQFQVVSESFEGIKEIRLMSLEQGVVKKFEKNAWDVANSKYISQTLKTIPRYLVEFICFSLIVFICLWLYVKGGLSHAIPTISLFAVSFYRLMPAVQQFYGAFVDSRFIFPAVEAIKDALTLKDFYEKSGSKMLRFKKNIELKDICYSYDEDSSLILDKFCLKINKGDFVGLVGKTGSGKSTLLNVISGLICPTKGELLIDGSKLGKAEASSWMNQLAYVHQHSFLFDGSVAENISLGVQAPNIEKIHEVSECADIFDTVNSQFENGFDTIVGERGLRLSGGQRQRICIARAIYREPELLILDEATNALDEETQCRVLENIKYMYPNITVLFVTHQQVALKFCSHVVKLGD